MTWTDTAPTFWAALLRSLRGYPLLHADRTGLVHRTQLQTPSHKSLSLKRISLLALLEPSDLSVRAYVPDPPSAAARPRLAGRRPAEQDRSMRAPSLSGERRSSAAACSPVRLSQLHDQQLSSRRPPQSQLSIRVSSAVHHLQTTQTKSCLLYTSPSPRDRG